jgi:hypothetical protein
MLSNVANDVDMEAVSCVGSRVVPCSLALLCNSCACATAVCLFAPITSALKDLFAL